MVKEIPADELARAKDDVALQFPKTFETTGRISGRLQALESLLVYGLPDDYYAKYCRRFRRSAPATSTAWHSNTLHPNHLAIVIVGDRKTIGPPIRALNLGSIKDDERRRGVCAGKVTEPAGVFRAQPSFHRASSRQGCVTGVRPLSLGTTMRSVVWSASSVMVRRCL